MGEILQIHVGQAGIQTGREVWDLLSKENSLEKNGKQKEQIYCQQNNESLVHQLFYELPFNKYVPRSIFMDLEPTCIDQTKKGEYRDLFSSSNFVNGKEDGIIYSRGMYSFGKEIVDLALEQIRKHVEKCCSFQGFVMNHSICGGTGSGFSSLLIERLDSEYQKKLKTSFTLFPSMYSNEIIENYNAGLSLHVMLEYTDMTVCLDNHALYNTLQQDDQVDFIQYKDINRLIAQLQSTFLHTCQCQKMNKISQNLIPFPRLHFLYGTSQPTYLECELGWKLDKLVKESFKNNNQFLSVKRSGTMFSCSVFGRGDIVPMDLIKKVHDIKNTLNFIDWVPNNLQIYQSDQKSILIQDDGSRKIKQSLSILQNNSVILENVRLIKKRFVKFFDKRAYLYWYLQEGMSQREFIETDNDLQNLIKDYEEVVEIDLD